MKMVSDGPDSLISVGLRFDLPGIQGTDQIRVAHLERGGINLDFAVEDDVLPSAEHTHEGDRVDETQSIVAVPPQGDLASIGFEKAGIANQTGARDIGVGDRQGSVRNKRSFWPNSSVAWNVTHSMLRICQIKYQKSYFMVSP